MTRDEMIRMAREAGWPDSLVAPLIMAKLAEFANIIAAAERNKLASWMMAKGYATGHGDTTDGLLGELKWQIAEGLKMEREACAKVAEQMLRHYTQAVTGVSEAIRARGKE